MILLAESGSTKTEWCLVNDDGIIDRYLTDGINPYFQSRREISHIIRLQLPQSFFKTKLNVIHFYGIGCSTQEKRDIVKASLEAQFRTSSIVESNLLGTARALFGDQPGIACILATASNSCFYDGNFISKNIRPLGYILGDEGSSASLGKVFLADCLKGLAPPELCSSFFNKYGIDPDQILDYIYSKPYPNKLLALLSIFLYDHMELPYVKNLIYQNLESFFTRNILQYDYQDYPVRFAGSFANMYKAELVEIATKLDIKLDMILDNTISGLIAYHKSKGRL